MIACLCVIIACVRVLVQGKNCGEEIKYLAACVREMRTVKFLAIC